MLINEESDPSFGIFDMPNLDLISPSGVNATTEVHPGCSTFNAT